MRQFFQHKKGEGGEISPFPCCFMKNYLAKSNPPESIRSHTDKLLMLLEQFNQVSPEALSHEEEELVRIAAEYHDYGKMSSAFQAKMNKFAKQDIEITLNDAYIDSAKEVPHGYLSPAFIPFKEMREKLGEEKYSVLVNAVYYHHTREKKEEYQIKDIITNDLKPRLENSYSISSNYLSYIMNPANHCEQDHWLKFAVIKGNLNRLDYAASAGRLALEEPRTMNNEAFGERVERILCKNYQLRDVQKYMKIHNDENLIIVASTGVGKTEAACLWAQDRKLFYTLPLKVSINAIYDRFIRSTDNGYDFSAGVTLLHSDALSILIQEENQDNAYDSLIKFEKSRLFSYPVTVCTIDQLFIFVYRYMGCEIIPAVLKYSYVVIDEIQTYSPEIAAKLIVGLQLIHRLGGKFAIITATMPPMFEDSIKRAGIPYSKPDPFLSPLKRHWLEFDETDFNYSLICEQANENSVLVICNTVKCACEVYNMLNDSNMTVHLLHSRFKLKHRRLLEQDIIDCSDRNDKGIWVSTQIVEASLDIDFDFLHTEMCSADSLLQRLGRCRRKREYIASEPNVFVYNTKNGLGKIYDKDIFERSIIYLKQYCGRIFTETEKVDYVNRVYNTNEIKQTQYYRKFNNEKVRIEKLPPFIFSAEEAKEKFREICSVSVIEDDDYNQLISNGTLKMLAEELSSGDKKRIAKARIKFLDHTISYNPQYHKIQPDTEPITYEGRRDIFPRTFRIAAKYDFNEITHKGLGLDVDNEYVNSIY